MNLSVAPPSGRVATGATATPPWHSSMRYFRMAEVTDDLFDSFRNTYLALESLLSEIEAMQQRSNGRGWESEETGSNAP